MSATMISTISTLKILMLSRSWVKYLVMQTWLVPNLSRQPMLALPQNGPTPSQISPKLHIKDSNGNLLFTIRVRPTTSYGSLAEEHHGNIAYVLKLDAFTLTHEDDTPLNVRAEIGSEEQAVRVVSAHDTDNWQRYCWRVDVYGRVQQFFEL
ncbi:hypothetical protein OS493_016068 [Desmophyllum pertusum]|uniref:Uncharacterized protein n=1 Tax=Desmophyllum pertusum TaxID=174260 RepID=A0A9X0D9S5_9CNID|nr:hypothetical protein OS493_016068 [Desmophyllum pertusum]